MPDYQMAPKLNTDRVPEPLHIYPTPLTHVKVALAKLYSIQPTLRPKRILDPGAGTTGVWGLQAKKLFPEAEVTGVKLRKCDNPGVDKWVSGQDFLSWEPEERFDLIVGNPPYGFPTRDSLERFIRHSYKMLTPSGVMIFFVRRAYLAGQRRSERLWKTHGPIYEFVSSRRPSFTGNGKTDSTDFTYIVWKKSWANEWFYGTWIRSSEFVYWDTHELEELNAVLV